MKASDIPAKFPIPFANNAGAGFVRSIPAASQIGIQAGAASLTDGFPPVTFIPVGAGGTPPFGQDFNGILKEITLWSQWEGAGGLVTYDGTFAGLIGGYPKGAILAGTAASAVWLCLVDNNTTNPDAGGAGWVLIATSMGVQAGTWVYGVDTGAVNALVVTATPAPAAYTAGMMLFVKVANTNTGATTINVNGLGLKSVNRPNGTRLLQDDLVGGGISLLVYDGTQFQAVEATNGGLNGNITIYVNGAIGNNSNDGTANDAAHALATIQAGVNLAFNYGPSAFTITVHVADGNYAGFATPAQPGPNIIVSGNMTTPSNVVVNGGSAPGAASVSGPNTMLCQGIKVVTGTPGIQAAGFVALSGATMSTNNTASGFVEGAVFEAFQATCKAGSHVFQGNSTAAFLAQVGGLMALNAGAQYTIASAISVSSFAEAINNATLAVSATTPSFVNPSNVSGQRYSATLNGVITTNGGGANFFPGTIAGATSGGGQYA